MAGAIGELGRRIAVPRIRKKAALFLVTGIIAIFGIETVRPYAADSLDTPVISYLTSFNVPEIFSRDISPFYKWTGVLRRMDARTKPLQPWLDNSKMLESLSPADMVQKVDDIINSYDYVADITNWGVSDYWETPAEFFAHGGDCEDFAIAKYAWLRSLGVVEDRLRIAIVYDRIRNQPHAVLILFINNKTVILDNQVREIRESNANSRYRIIYSINRLGWWYPVGSKDVKVSEGGDDAPQFSKACVAGALLPECINAIEPAGR